ncbi:MAG: CvpA family protein [Tannerella sp.]|jgi:membrane protein required for colicin V production|nr:CvpA family protein [Tannerella sp.]
MNWLDITIVCLAVIGFVKGYSEGFIRQMVMLIALIAAIYLCAAVAVYLRGFIRETGWLPEHGVTVASYVLAFLLIVCVITLVGNILHKIMDVTPLSFLNHLAGGVFALGFTILLVGLTLHVIDGSDHDSILIPQDIKNKSRLYHPVKKIVPTVYIGTLFEGEIL